MDSWFYAVKLRLREKYAKLLSLVRIENLFSFSHYPLLRKLLFSLILLLRILLAKPKFYCVKPRIHRCCEKIPTLYFLFECVKSSCAPKRYQPYTSCSHRKSFFFQPLSLAGRGIIQYKGFARSMRTRLPRLVSFPITYGFLYPSTSKG